MWSGSSLSSFFPVESTQQRNDGTNEAEEHSEVMSTTRPQQPYQRLPIPRTSIYSALLPRTEQNGKNKQDRTEQMLVVLLPVAGTFPSTPAHPMSGYVKPISLILRSETLTRELLWPEQQHSVADAMLRHARRLSDGTHGEHSLRGEHAQRTLEARSHVRKYHAGLALETCGARCKGVCGRYGRDTKTRGETQQRASTQRK